MKVKIYSICLVMAFLSGLINCFAQCDPTCPGEIIAHHPIGSIAPETVDITYQTVKYDDLCWITKNLGATQQADSATDASEAAAGWYWQFNRKQGYSWNSTNSTRTPNTTWITSIDESSDWLAENDPCALLLGSGWHIPTNTDWSSAVTNGGWGNYSDAYASLLKLHTAGYIGCTSGTFGGEGEIGFYWSRITYSSANTNGNLLQLIVGSSTVVSSNKAYGSSVRCCKTP